MLVQPANSTLTVESVKQSLERFTMGWGGQETAEGSREKASPENRSRRDETILTHVRQAREWMARVSRSRA